VHTEKLIPVCDSQLEGANGLDRRNEISHDKEVGRAVSQGASNESENLAVNSIFVHLVQDRRSGELRIYRLGVLDVIAVDPISALLHRSAVHSTEALDFDQSHPVVKFRGIMTVEHRGTTSVDQTVRDDTVDQLFVLGANVALLDTLAEIPFARAESTADCMDPGLFHLLYHHGVKRIVGRPSVVARDAGGSDNVFAEGVDPKSA